MKLVAADLVTFAEEILNGKLHFLCSDMYICPYISYVFVIVFSAIIKIKKILETVTSFTSSWFRVSFQVNFFQLCCPRLCPLIFAL